MEEHSLLQSTKIKDLETYIDASRHQFNEIYANAQSKSKEAKDMEIHLENAETQKRKLELQYERSLADIESSKKHSVDLTTMIIEKVNLMEFRFAGFFFFCRRHNSHRDLFHCFRHRTKKSNQRNIRY